MIQVALLNLFLLMLFITVNNEPSSCGSKHFGHVDSSHTTFSVSILLQVLIIYILYWVESDSDSCNIYFLFLKQIYNTCMHNSHQLCTIDLNCGHIISPPPPPPREIETPPSQQGSKVCKYCGG